MPDSPAEPDGSLDDRVGKLETGQDTLSGKIDQILGILSGGKDEPGEPAPAPDVAQQIRDQLDERDRKQAADAETKSGQDWRAGVDAKLAELSEKQPEPPQTRRERIMWGRR